eukprot:scaffold288788_cov26-Tisochrysis_lutea.AAC.1
MKAAQLGLEAQRGVGALGDIDGLLDREAVWRQELGRPPIQVATAAVALHVRLHHLEDIVAASGESSDAFAVPGAEVRQMLDDRLEVLLGVNELARRREYELVQRCHSPNAALRKNAEDEGNERGAPPSGGGGVEQHRRVHERCVAKRAHKARDARGVKHQHQPLR